MNPSTIDIIGATLFAIAVLHTFSTKFFEKLAHAQPNHAGLWHLLGEVEAVFGFWAMVLVVFMAFAQGHDAAVHYLDTRNYTEPLFVFAIMVIAASKPILTLAGMIVRGLASILPMNRQVAYFVTSLSIVPLMGSFITEPAAMTLAAFLLRDRFYTRGLSNKLMYATLGALFVNVSIGGTLTPFAAPPVLMVAAKWGFDMSFMLSTFGWKAALAVFLNAMVVTVLFAKEIAAIRVSDADKAENTMPVWVIGMHLLFLVGVVVFAHHAAVFMGLFLFFLGYASAYKDYQDRLILKEGLMVAFFLAGLVVLGGMQSWWLQDVLTKLSPTALYYGATALTAITDNAALTYLGSLVEGVGPEFKYALVAGAVTGGGLTVIANAPNPAGYAILKPYFSNGAISAGGLFIAAFPPTVVAILAFQLL
ncbi:putative Na+/H+ antiporter [Limnobacter humi]|uniref:Na+/H+ antiporter n=1 Tax=Limnobacter humi TaxID=1778671 RepID=A0ABT1WH65_9BURK|nr:putative Na+/H+ antiporter [Limnobacter humi]